MDDLALELSVPERVGAGALVVGEVAVRNEGEPMPVSSWLGLEEGDLWLHVVDPAGQHSTVHGRYQLDVLPQQVTLDTGESIARGLQLSVTSPRLFEQPGSYRIRAVYAPGAGMTEVESAETTLVVEPVPTAAERDVPRLLDAEGIDDSIAFGHLDASSPAAAVLPRVGRECPDRLEAAAARILVAASSARDDDQPDWETVFGDLGRAEIARLVTAFQPPASTREDPLTLAALRAVSATDPSNPAGARATAMLRGEPIGARPSGSGITG